MKFSHCEGENNNPRIETAEELAKKASFFNKLSICNGREAAMMDKKFRSCTEKSKTEEKR